MGVEAVVLIVGRPVAAPSPRARFDQARAATRPGPSHGFGDRAPHCLDVVAVDTRAGDAVTARPTCHGSSDVGVGRLRDGPAVVLADVDDG